MAACRPHVSTAVQAAPLTIFAPIDVIACLFARWRTELRLSIAQSRLSVFVSRLRR
jgi:hypothetical protein